MDGNNRRSAPVVVAGMKRKQVHSTSVTTPAFPPPPPRPPHHLSEQSLSSKPVSVNEFLAGPTESTTTTATTTATTPTTPTEELGSSNSGSSGGQESVASCGDSEMLPRVDVFPLGAAQEVGRSCFVVVLDNEFVVLFDCGLHPLYNDERRFPQFCLLYTSDAADE